MRRQHFNALRPICPVCREAGQPESVLRIGQVVREEGGHIVEGVLHCSNANCFREYPIVDGVPFLVSSIRRYVAEHLLAMSVRQDLSGVLESLIGDCCGPGSDYDRIRQQLSCYAWDHYADLDPLEKLGDPAPGSMVRNLRMACANVGGRPLGPVIDLGCAVGRGTLELAESTGELVLGVDLNPAMLRLAADVLRQGKVRYARRRLGLVYERREFRAQFAQVENVDFWACDAAALPFSKGTFALAVSMNSLDCMHAPRAFLEAIAGALREGGKAVLACPYDWSLAATPLEGWLGGHSQRTPLGGASEAILRSLLTPGASPHSIPGLRLVGEQENLPWHVRLHERSTMLYQTHLLVAAKEAEAAS